MVLNIKYFEPLKGVKIEYTHALEINTPAGQRMSDLYATDVNGYFWGYEVK